MTTMGTMQETAAGWGVQGITKISAEPRAEARGLVSPQESSWVGCTASRLGRECLCSAASGRRLCVYAVEQERKMLSASSFVPGKVPQQALKSV